MVIIFLLVSARLFAERGRGEPYQGRKGKEKHGNQFQQSSSSVNFNFMKKASIVSIGDELLSGQTIGTNASYLSEKLLSIGIPVVSSYTVADDIDSIVRSFNLAGSDADVVLATGGLGPTDDDLTRQAFAKLLGTDLELKDELLKKIQDFFTSRT